MLTYLRAAELKVAILNCWEHCDIIFSKLGYKLVNKLESYQESIPKVPTITVLGHVDHGKTSLIDCIINTHLVDNEVGHITQCVRTHCIKYKGNLLNIVDTPGHSLFEIMRRKSILVTDLAILLIACNEGIKQQTLECVNHVLQIGTLYVVVYSKIDLGIDNTDKIKLELTKYGVTVDSLGGETPELYVSSISKENVKALLDCVCLYVDMNCLRCELLRPAVVVMFDSHFVKGLGLISRCLLFSGYITNLGWPKLFGAKLAVSSMLVDLVGLPISVSPGDSFELRTQRVGVCTKAARAQSMTSECNQNVILKADSCSALECLVELLIVHKIGIIKKGLGSVTDSDISLAKQTSANIVCFNVKVRSELQLKLKSMNCNLICDDLVYNILGKLISWQANQYSFQAEIKNLFYVENQLVYGAKLLKGTVRLHDVIKVLRANKLVFTAQIKSLRCAKLNVMRIACQSSFSLVLNTSKRANVNDVICM